jgi:dihydropteroate synthase
LKSIKVKGQLLTIEKPIVMGIINITPDSFFAESRFSNDDKLIEKVAQHVHDGAEIIDLGAASSKPGALEISEEEEIIRLLPALKNISKHFPNLIISVDTYRANVAKIATENGADIINDISAGTTDANMFSTIAQLGVPYIMMHRQGTSATMQKNPTYHNVVKEVLDFFIEKVYLAKQVGINDLVIDPGFGFGKTVEHNYDLLKNLEVFQLLDVPVLVGLSRKAMINKVLGVDANKALNGTTVLNTLALNNGANILRVHDVKEAKEAVELYYFYKNIQSSNG